MYNILRAALILTIICFCVPEADAQRRSRRRVVEEESQQEQKTLKERLTYEIGIGNTSLFNGRLNLGIRPTIAYKATDWLYTGIGGKYIFQFFNIINGPDITSHNGSIFPYVQIKVTESIYLKGLYEYGSYEFLTSNFNKATFTDLSPFFGGGYTSGYGDWKWGFEILFVGNGNLRDRYELLEYWIVVSKNF